jgi:putative oxidoreductase
MALRKEGSFRQLSALPPILPAPYALNAEDLLQRLFWTFAGGWPGIGLLIQRITIGGLLLYCAASVLAQTSQSAAMAPAIVGAAAGIMLLVGLWTPIAGALIALVEMWNVFTQPTSPVISVTLGILGATLAMIGPGAWSVDARLFGRKHIDTP